MRFKLYFDLENEHFPIDYHRNILSFIKSSLSDYSEEYYKKLYHDKDPLIKPYTFAVFFKEPQFEDSEIIIKDKKFELNISIEDYSVAIILYNSFNKKTHETFHLNKNSWRLQNIKMLMEKPILSDEILVKFMSPLVVRSRIDKKDQYFSFEDEKFLETLKINIKEQLKITDISKEIVDSFKIEPIEPKKTVIRFYEKQIECSLGTYKLIGDRGLLEYLYKAGMSSKHSSGFRDVPDYIVRRCRFENKSVLK